MGNRITRRAVVLSAVLTLAPLTVSFGKADGSPASVLEIETAELCARGSCRPKPGWDCIIDDILVAEKCDTATPLCNAKEE